MALISYINIIWCFRLNESICICICEQRMPGSVCLGPTLFAILFFIIITIIIIIIILF